jgi:tetratricopeptide (TPR) repeat protein
MQQRPAPARGPVAPGNKGRVGERASSSSKAADSQLNPQQRLLRGYQHQLAGDYDEAMREYRVIIKSSPELLGEIVSNMRALLKLAPSYATGYRVLGDAYMRQGEYLQAMEAYNKALTMAKKARS